MMQNKQKAILSLSGLTRNALEWIGKSCLPMMPLVLPDKLDIKRYLHGFLNFHSKNYCLLGTVITHLKASNFLLNGLANILFKDIAAPKKVRKYSRLSLS